MLRRLGCLSRVSASQRKDDDTTTAMLRVAAKHTQISSIQLDEAFIGSNATVALAELLISPNLHHSPITKLQLLQCKFEGDLAPLRTGLEQASALKDLTLDCMELDSGVAMGLCNCAAKSGHVTDLTVSLLTWDANNPTSETLKTAAAAVRSLKVECNDLTHLFRMLDVNPIRTLSLTDLQWEHLGGNSSYEGKKAFNQVLTYLNRDKVEVVRVRGVDVPEWTSHGLMPFDSQYSTSQIRIFEWAGDLQPSTQRSRSYLEGLRQRANSNQATRMQMLMLTGGHHVAQAGVGFGSSLPPTNVFGTAGEMVARHIKESSPSPDAARMLVNMSGVTTDANAQARIGLSRDMRELIEKYCSGGDQSEFANLKSLMRSMYIELTNEDVRILQEKGIHL